MLNVDKFVKQPFDSKSLELCEYAVKVLKQIGFELYNVSQCSEACYYKYPGIEGLIRVANHRYGRTESRLIYLPLLSSITFTPTSHFTIASINSNIFIAIGKYFVYSKIYTKNHNVALKLVPLNCIKGK